MVVQELNMVFYPGFVELALRFYQLSAAPTKWDRVPNSA